MIRTAQTEDCQSCPTETGAEDVRGSGHWCGYSCWVGHFWQSKGVLLLIGSPFTCEKGRPNCGKIITYFFIKGADVPLLNCGSYLQMIVETNKKSGPSLFINLRVPAGFEAIDFLHFVIVISSSVRFKDRRTAKSYSTRTQYWPSGTTSLQAWRLLF